MFRGFVERIMGKKSSKNDKKLQKKVRKMKAGDALELHGYEVICADDEFYLLIHPNEGIHEKHFNEIKEWVVTGEFIN